jgi:5-oxoprolinase (ATP-hydrolysing)
MPLNQGVLDPITNIVPEGSFLNPTGAVAISGSTISSQRLVDVILRAFEAAACSQGCASSTGFGSGGRGPDGTVIPGFTYGESLGGGSGAGPTWHGRNATCVVSWLSTEARKPTEVQHSTNTRMTDVEIFEQRTPMIMVESTIRRGSGGRGRYNGGGLLSYIQCISSKLLTVR